MHTDLGKKLIAVLDVNQLKLFTAEGLKILGSAQNFNLESVHHFDDDQDGSDSKRKLNSGGIFAPHTSTKELNIKDSSKLASTLIEQSFKKNKEFKELILVCDSKLLGVLRHDLNHNIKKFVSKEINKDLTHHTINSIEKVIFGD